MSGALTKTAWAGPLVYREARQIDHKATGDAMRQLRKCHRLSLREVARFLKLSAPFVSDLELGRRNWDSSRALKYMLAVTSLYVAEIQKSMNAPLSEETRNLKIR